MNQIDPLDFGCGMMVVILDGLPSLEGIPLKVHAVDYPFAVVSIPRGNGRVVIDVREKSFVVPSAEYVRAIVEVIEDGPACGASKKS